MSVSNLTDLYNNVVKNELSIDQLGNLFPVWDKDNLPEYDKNKPPRNLVTPVLTPEQLEKIRHIYLNERTTYTEQLQEKSGMSWVGRKVFSLSRGFYSFFYEDITVKMTLTLLKGVYLNYKGEEKRIKTSLKTQMVSDQDHPWMAKKEITKVIKEVQAKVRSDKADLNETLIKEDFLDQIKDVVTEKLERDHLPLQLFAKVFNIEIDDIKKVDLLSWKKFDGIAAYLSREYQALIDKYKQQVGEEQNDDLHNRAVKYADDLIKIVVDEIKPTDTLENVKAKLEANIKELKDEAFKVLSSKAQLKVEGYTDEIAKKQIEDSFQAIKKKEFDAHHICHPDNERAIDLAIDSINRQMAEVVEQGKKDSYLRYCEKIREAVLTTHRPFLERLEKDGFNIDDYKSSVIRLNEKLRGLDYNKKDEISATIQELYDALPVKIRHLNDKLVNEYNEAGHEIAKKEAEAKVHEGHFRAKQKEGFTLLASILKKVLGIKISDNNKVVTEIDHGGMFNALQGKQDDQEQESSLSEIKDYIIELTSTRNKGDPKLKEMINEINHLFINLEKRIQSYQLRSIPESSNTKAILPIRELLNDALRIRSRVLEFIQERGLKVKIQGFITPQKKENPSLLQQSFLNSIEATEGKYSRQMALFIGDHGAEDYFLQVNENILANTSKDIRSLGEMLTKFKQTPSPALISSATEGLPPTKIDLSEPEYRANIKEAPKDAVGAKRYTWENLMEVPQTAPSYMFDFSFTDLAGVPEFSERFSALHTDTNGAKVKFLELLHNLFVIDHQSNGVVVNYDLEYWRIVLPALPQIVKIWQQPQTPSLLALSTEMDFESAFLAYMGWLLAHQNRLNDINEGNPVHLNTVLSRLAGKPAKLVELRPIFADFYSMSDSFFYKRAKDILEGGFTAGVAFKAASVKFGVTLEGSTENKLLQLGNAAVDKVKYPRLKAIRKFLLFLAQGLLERHKAQDLLPLITDLEAFSKAMSEAIEVKGDTYTLKNKEKILKTYPDLIKRIAGTLSKFIADGSKNPVEKRAFEAIQSGILNFKLDTENKNYYSQLCDQLVTNVIDSALGLEGKFTQKAQANRSRIYFFT